MSILCRYALQSYLRTLLLSIFSFVGVLLIARFKEMARFTALSGHFSTTGLFIVYHIPTILPVAIPISAFLAAFLFSQRAGRSFELLALRSSGLSLQKMMAPLLLASFLLAMVNFFICAEVAPFCRREGKTLLFHETSSNPLLLLQRQKLIKLKDTYLNMKAQNERLVSDLIFITPREKGGSLSLFSAQKLWLEEDSLVGNHLAMVSYFPDHHLFVENQAQMSTSATLLSKAMKKNRARLDIHALSFKMLRLYEKQNQAQVEMLRRVCISIAVFSFTLLGASFGIEEGRSRTKKHLLFALCLALSVLLSYLLGKELKNHPLFASFVFFTPHPIVWGASFFHLYRIERGKVA